MDNLSKLLARGQNVILIISVLLIGGFLLALAFSFDAPEDILQALATIIGSGLSGLVAAVVALSILQREERARDEERHRTEAAHEKQRIAELTALNNWIMDVTGFFLKILDEIEKSFLERIDDEAINLVTAHKQAESMRKPSLLTSSIATKQPLFEKPLELVGEPIEEVIDQLTKSYQVSTTIDRSDTYTSLLDMSKFIGITNCAESFAYELSRLREIDPHVAATCSSCAAQIFRTVERCHENAKKQGAIISDDYKKSRQVNKDVS